MFREYFILLLLGHILGDFYFQTVGMAKKKDNSIKWVLFHCICYWISMLFVMIFTKSCETVFVTIVAAILHLVIDVLKYNYLLLMSERQKKTQIMERNIFFVDQILHLFCLGAIAYCLTANNITIREWNVVSGFFKIINVEKMPVVSWILALLIIHKPANIVIQKLLIIYKPDKKGSETKQDNNAGRFIGTVERIIMLILLTIGQYSAIGFVLTAKSIARYDRISKEKNFAEYYLLGTLVSMIVVIICSFII